jgi:hypothetical protein
VKKSLKVRVRPATQLLRGVVALGEELLRRCRAAMVYCRTCCEVTDGAEKKVNVATKEANVARTYQAVQEGKQELQ